MKAIYLIVFLLMFVTSSCSTKDSIENNSSYWNCKVFKLDSYDVALKKYSVSECWDTNAYQKNSDLESWCTSNISSYVYENFPLPVPGEFRSSLAKGQCQ